MTVLEREILVALLEQTRGEGIISSELIVVGLARMGTKSAIIRAGRLKTIKEKQFDVFPQAIVIPGSLHFAEAEALVKLWGAPDEILNLG